MATPSYNMSYREALLTVLRAKEADPYLDIMLAFFEPDGDEQSSLLLTKQYQVVFGKPLTKGNWEEVLAEMASLESNNFYFYILQLLSDSDAQKEADADTHLSRRCLLVYSKVNGSATLMSRAKVGSFKFTDEGVLEGFVISDGSVESVKVLLPTWPEKVDLQTASAATPAAAEPAKVESKPDSDSEEGLFTGVWKWIKSKI